MKRRDFLAGVAVGAATVFGVPDAATQTPAPGERQGGPAPAGAGGQAQPAGRGRGRGRGPAAVPPAKLARVSLMTLNFNPYIREPGNANPTPDQTLTAFDLPKMYVESYGVHNIEYQHGTIVQSEKDPAFIKELKARLDENNVKMTQINLEFGTFQSISTKDPEGRRQAVEHVKQWMDIAAQYGCPRVMINQQQMQLTNETRAGAVEAMKSRIDGQFRSADALDTGQTRPADT